jgi:hypothetical protein
VQLWDWFPVEQSKSPFAFEPQLSPNFEPTVVRPKHRRDKNGFLIVSPRHVDVIGSVEEGNLEIYIRGVTRKESMAVNFKVTIGDRTYTQAVHTGPGSDGERFLHDSLDETMRTQGAGVYEQYC